MNHHAPDGEIQVGLTIGQGNNDAGWRVYLCDLAPWAREAVAKAMHTAAILCDQTPGPGHVDGCPGGMDVHNEARRDHAHGPNGCGPGKCVPACTWSPPSAAEAETNPFMCSKCNVAGFAEKANRDRHEASCIEADRGV